MQYRMKVYLRQVGLMIVAMAIASGSQSARAVAELVPHDIVFGAFGDGERDYARHDIRELNKLDAITVVSCYDVTTDQLLVCDFFRSEVKIYSRDGRYQSTIRVDSRGGPIALAADGVSVTALYEPIARPVDPSIEWSRFQLVVYDIKTGQQKQHHFLHSGVLGVDTKDGARYGGATVLYSSERDLWLVDASMQKSLLLFANGKFVDREQSSVLDGWGPHFKSIKRPDGFSVVKSDGQTSAVIPQSPIAVAPDGSRFAIAAVEGGKEMVVTVYSVDGTALAVAKSSLEPFRWDLTPGSGWGRYRIVGESLFELRVDETGVHVIEWR